MGKQQIGQLAQTRSNCTTGCALSTLRLGEKT
jgi:hypothetical protein